MEEFSRALKCAHLPPAEPVGREAGPEALPSHVLAAVGQLLSGADLWQASEASRAWREAAGGAAGARLGPRVAPLLPRDAGPAALLRAYAAVYSSFLRGGVGRGAAWVSWAAR
jgi:hypothetical protein